MARSNVKTAWGFTGVIVLVALTLVFGIQMSKAYGQVGYLEAQAKDYQCVVAAGDLVIELLQHMAQTDTIPYRVASWNPREVKVINADLSFNTWEYRQSHPDYQVSYGEDELQPPHRTGKWIMYRFNKMRGRTWIEIEIYHDGYRFFRRDY